MKFTEWGFDVSLASDTGYLPEELPIPGGGPIVPTRRLTYVVTNHSFEMRFLYTQFDFSELMHPATRPDFIPISNMEFEVDDKDALDYWLDEQIQRQNLNLCVPLETVNPTTGEREIRVLQQDQIAHVSVKQDGSMTLKAPSLRVSLSESGAHVDCASISKISLDNVLDLNSYSVTRNSERTFHIFAFESGAHGEITYGANGRIETFSVHGRVSFGKEGEIIIFSEAAA